MKCATPGCGNKVIDFTENPTRQCGKCRMLALAMYFGFPKEDTERLDSIQVDKQTLVERSNYGQHRS